MTYVGADGTDGPPLIIYQRRPGGAKAPEAHLHVENFCGPPRSSELAPTQRAS